MNELHQLINKYWQGTSSPEEMRRLYQLLSRDNAADLYALQVEYDEVIEKYQERMPGDADQRVLTGLLGEINKQASIVSFSRNRLQFWKTAIVAVAACAALLIAVTMPGIWSLKQQSATHQQEIAANEMTVIRADKPMHIELTDGTGIVLEKGSSIQYSKQFGVAERKVYLEGNAIFTVIRNEAIPFAVVADGIITTALGTKFAVSKVAMGKVQIHLYEGKVSVAPVSGKADRILMMPGESLLVEPEGFKTSLTAPVSTAKKMISPAATNEANGELIFKEASLEHIFDVLGRKFEKTIICNDSDVVAYRFTGNFPAEGSDCESILRTLCGLNKLAYTIKGNTIYINKQ
ncbi:FecR protein [Chitinophaga dinghuensis]|uniref:FecR protein n=1 Tax=Chitinophaga dinghuensis TaxID=1539050 RepID=A0A327WCU7_9BACT|nr:FecR domain-containing protein [Chitinophaga dinghuensis]RAJ88069.1 FecR protein [Chitinophaga dinghuensis]